MAAELVAFPQLPSDPYLWGLLLEITFSQLSTNSGIAIFFFLTCKAEKKNMQGLNVLQKATMEFCFTFTLYKGNS